MLRRLHPEQPESFAFTPDNQSWAEKQVTKYPEGRQASAIIPLLWRAQEQEGWLTRPAIEHVADMLGMAYIRALEVATFYFMFQLQPVGSVAHVQICGTTSCMICGAEDLIAVCREKIAANAHELSPDGKFSWEEVECLGACANAPMAQIGKDYYEDLTEEKLADLLDRMAAGELPVPGPQDGRFASEPAHGLTSLAAEGRGRLDSNASVTLATEIGDTLRRIDGSEVPLRAPWRPANRAPDPGDDAQDADRSGGRPADETGATKQQAPAKEKARPKRDEDAAAETKPAPEADDKGPPQGEKPQLLEAAREGGADDLKKIKGIGPKLEQLLHSMGVYHFDQIAGWSDAEVAWVDDNLDGFKGRVTRDEWVRQARQLAGGGETEFSKRVDDGDVY